MAKVCCKAMVSGKVQGAIYRTGTQRQARQPGVSGCANNLADGQVGFEVC